MEAHTGIDVFNSPFPESGFTTFIVGDIRLLVFRIELNDNKISQIVQEFLGLKSYRFANMNAGETLQHGPVYKKLKSLDLPKSLLDAAHNTKYFKHFYDGA